MFSLTKLEVVLMVVAAAGFILAFLSLLLLFRVKRRISRLEKLQQNPGRPNNEESVHGYTPRPNIDSFERYPASFGRSLYRPQPSPRRTDEPEEIAYRPRVLTRSQEASSEAAAPLARREDAAVNSLQQILTEALRAFAELCGDRAAGAGEFIKKFQVVSLEATSESGRFAKASLGGGDYIWGIALDQHASRVMLLPGKDMVQRWPLLAKAGGSGAEAKLNGAYVLRPDPTGDLKIIQPAIATYRDDSQTYILTNQGALTGTTD